MNSTFVLGLTGQTGSGKSTVARELAKRGAYVVNADEIARRVTEPGTPVLQELVRQFSTAILHPNGTLNRAALAAAAFATPEATATLNAIVHPEVIRRITDTCTAARANGESLVVLDVPLLFQVGLDSLCDTTVAVVAPEAVRCRRICERDGLSPKQANDRMQAQPTTAYYTERANRIVVNDGSEEQLQQAVASLYREVTA